ncbi:MAG: CCA tRNA nucleotidyltransferase, partial [Chloroflexus sp.]|nr:CCA tRNA nucleotidyltransferase [Chloroflexus sp.]
TSPSELDKLLQPYSVPAIAVLHFASNAPIQPATSRYLREWRSLRPPLNGDDLRALGVTPGPRLGQLLYELRAATLDGLITDRAAAEQWVRQQLANS